MMTMSLISPPTLTTPASSDLLNTEDHIQYLFGYPDGTFGPENNMTRAEVAQMFYNPAAGRRMWRLPRPSTMFPPTPGTPRR